MTIFGQVPPFRKLRQEKTKGRRAKLGEMLYYDYAQMRTAFTGRVPMIGESNPYANRVKYPIDYPNVCYVLFSTRNVDPKLPAQ